MVLLADHPVRPEPHDFIIFKRDLLTQAGLRAGRLPAGHQGSEGVRRVPQWQEGHGEDDSQAPAFSLREFKLKKGDEVTLILTNLDKIEDLTHGFAIPKYNVNFIVNPQETASVTFIADKPGVFWCYCTLLPCAAPRNAQSHDRRSLTLTGGARVPVSAHATMKHDAVR
jgi:nitrous-oxide reductase